MLWLGIMIFGAWTVVCIVLAIGVRSLGRLRDVPPIEGDAPRVSVIVAARDEIRNIEQALQSLIALDYPSLEIIVVDDRSTDGTGEALDRIAARHARVRAIHNTALPEGWLGKNHALQLGASHATGELLLFTDADIVFAPDSVRRAVQFLVSRRIDHLAITPDIRMPGFWTNAFFGFFAISFSIAMKPWRARNPKAREAVGIGAFNLVRASAYRAINGHERLRMRPDDDMKLGEALKRGGHRADVLMGNDMLWVEWYPDLPSMIRGLEKNSFATFDYSLVKLLPPLLLHQVVNVWPWIAVFITSGVTQLVYLGCCLLTLMAWLVNARAGTRQLGYALVQPLVAMLFAFTILRAAWLNLRQGGIRWRDTFYPIDQLRTPTD